MKKIVNNIKSLILSTQGMRISVSSIDRNSLEIEKHDLLGDSTNSVIYKILFFIGHENQNFWEVIRVHL